MSELFQSVCLMSNSIRYVSRYRLFSVAMWCCWLLCWLCVVNRKVLQQWRICMRCSVCGLSSSVLWHTRRWASMEKHWRNAMRLTGSVSVQMLLLDSLCQCNSCVVDGSLSVDAWVTSSMQCVKAEHTSIIVAHAECLTLVTPSAAQCRHQNLMSCSS